MKTVLGIDATQESLNAITMIHRLAFPQTQLQLIHVVERLSPEEWTSRPHETNALAQFLRIQEQEGQEALDKAGSLARDLKLTHVAALKYGSTVANQLLEVARETKADLIAIGSRDESALGKLLIGSVGRKLVSSSPHSLCIVRNEAPDPRTPFDAVFATDHSEYASRCVDTLLQLAPQGLRRLIIMTAYPREMMRPMRNFMPQSRLQMTDWMELNLNEQNQRVKGRLKALNCEIQSRVVANHPDQAIDDTMQDTGAGLLIMGAQGHGFLERLATGSQTFRQAVAGQHSVLILRAPH